VLKHWAAVLYSASCKMSRGKHDTLYCTVLTPKGKLFTRRYRRCYAILSKWLTHVYRWQTCCGGTSSRRLLSWWTPCWWCCVRSRHRSRSCTCSTMRRCSISGGGSWRSYQEDFVSHQPRLPRCVLHRGPYLCYITWGAAVISSFETQSRIDPFENCWINSHIATHIHRGLCWFTA